jgi:anaerobic dimethyl sulfoxide reductase subunit B
MSQTGLYFNQTRCIGCYTCQVACKDWHDIGAGPVNWIGLRVIEKGKFPDLFLGYLVSTCFHCEKPACVNACPQDAITKRKTDGIGTVDPDKCTGKDECGVLCLKACPWDAPQFGVENNARMQKCDSCVDRIENGEKPVCVDACPMLALDIGPFEELKDKYGNDTGASGFRYVEKIGPSVTFKPKIK